MVAALATVPAQEPGFAPRGRLLVPTALAEDEAKRRPRIRRQAEAVGRGRAIDPWPFAESTPDHPGYGLSPKRVLRIFRESEAGNLRELADLYDDLLESDGHLRSTVESRIKAISGKNVVLQEGGADDASMAAAEALSAALEDEDLDLVHHIEHQLEAAFRGYSASEIHWGLRDGRWVPVKIDDLSHRRFRFDPATNELRLATRADRVHGEELWSDKWIISKARHSNLARAGLLRTATWWALFKRLSMRDWIVFAERFGIPHAIGYYQDDASEEARMVLEQALKDLGEGGQAVLHEFTKIVFAEVAQRDGDTSAVHPAIIDRCDAEISKLISGATLLAESGGPGSFALGKVHEARAFSLELADAAHMQRVWRRFVAKPFIEFNGYKAAGARPPRLQIQVFPELDPKTRVEIMSTLVNDLGMEVDGWHVAGQLGYRRPARPEDAARPMRDAASGPATQEGDEA